MLSYRPANLAQASIPIHPTEASQRPGTVANLAILGVGILIGAFAFPYYRKPLGAVALGAGSSVAGAGLVLVLLDLFGKPPSV